MRLALVFVLLLGLVTSTTARALAIETPIKMKLQWFNPNGHLSEVDWHVNTRWIWKPASSASGPVPVLEVGVELPSQIAVEGASEPSVRVFDGSSGQLLIFEMHSRSETLNLDTASGSETPDKATLLATVESEQPELLIHESCAQAGISLASSPSVPPKGDAPMYLGLTCVRGHGHGESHEDWLVRVQVPEGASVEDSVIHIRPGMSSRVGVTELGQAGQGGSWEYELKMEAPGRQTHARSAAPARSSTPENAPSAAVSPLQFIGQLVPAYVSYSAPGTDPGFNPSELTLVAGARLYPVRPERKRLVCEAEAQISLLPLNSTALTPASGSDFLALRGGSSALAWGNEQCFRLLAGWREQYVYFQKRSDGFGFLTGPDFAADLSNEHSRLLGDRGYEARLSFYPLMGRGTGAVFDSFGASGEVAFEISDKVLVGRRVDFRIRTEFLNLAASTTARLISPSLSSGIQVWF